MTASKPTKPFERYAWHWASVQPTEGLLIPPVYFGILRAINKCEGEQKSSPKIYAALLQVEEDTEGIRSPRLKLARDPARNLFRNSGQYWQSLGLLEETTGELRLTALGESVAEGETPVDDFVAGVVRSLELPNTRNDSPDVVALWNSAGLVIRPLELILRVLLEIPAADTGEYFITATELWRIIIPLAGAKASLKTLTDAIQSYRTGSLTLSGWPDCTPKSNDERSALEFPLFLAHNGLVTLDRSGRKPDWRFVLEPPQRQLANLILETASTGGTIDSATAKAADEQISVQVARTRRLVEQIHRPNQQKFKRECVRDHGEHCAVTGETTRAVLIAAHVIPVEFNGSDSSANGLLLRADIHLLFDAGLLKIYPDGQIELHPTLEASPTYKEIPSSVALPAKLNTKNLEWRLRYM